MQVDASSPLHGPAARELTRPTSRGLVQPPAALDASQSIHLRRLLATLRGSSTLRAPLHVPPSPRRPTKSASRHLSAEITSKTTSNAAASASMCRSLRTRATRYVPPMNRTDRTFDAVVVGAGFAGMFLAHLLKTIGLSFRVYEVGDDVGGTWYWNRYPGARCDVESMEYSYQFSEELQQDWVWTERYATQAEILAYLRDPETADKLTPRTHIGCKRLCLDTGYYEAYNRPNVHLVDVSEQPIARITAAGIVVAGHEYPLDVIVYATGFDAMTGPVLRIDIRGRKGRSLRDAWSAGPITYLGLGVPEFPNLFIVAGPGSPSVLTNMVAAIEQHGQWIADCIVHMREHGLRTIEASHDASEQWVEHVNQQAAATMYPTCNSWYLGANVPGKPRVFMPLVGWPSYVAACDESARRGYTDFVLT
jgi:putative NAD(P)-binding protein